MDCGAGTSGGANCAVAVNACRGTITRLLPTECTNDRYWHNAAVSLRAEHVCSARVKRLFLRTDPRAEGCHEAVMAQSRIREQCVCWMKAILPVRLSPSTGMMSPSCSSQCGSASPNTLSQLSSGRVSFRPRFTVPPPYMLFSTICSTLANLGDRNSPHSPCSGNLSCVKGLMKPISQRIAEALGVRDEQVAAAVALLDGGSTVPFVARYRKEVTGSLDDAQLRTLEERLRYLRELDEPRAAILGSIPEQGKLDAPLQFAINAAGSQPRPEGIY